MKSIIVLFLFIILNLNANAQYGVYYVGHSLINLNTPFIVKELRLAAGQTCVYRNHINIGASLKLQWQDPSYFNSNLIWDPVLGQDVEHGTDFTLSYAPGATPALQRNIITESVPLLDNPIDTTAKYGRLFHDMAKGHNSTIKNYMMATWEHVGTGSGAWATWRASINTLKTNWEQRVDAINTPSTSNNMYILPAGLALGALYDTLQLHAIGPLTHISQIFNDDIHMNNDGNYFIACVMYATIYLQSPQGLPAVQAGPYTSDFAINNATVRAKLQEIAWKVVQSYPRSGYLPPLAVSDLDCFSARNDLDKVIIEFCLQNNSPTQNIIIEHSKNAIDFEPIKEFKEINEGRFYHNESDKLVNGNNYFRLNFKHEDGYEDYSKIIPVYFEKDIILMYPNPVHNMLNINTLNKDNSTSIIIFNQQQQPVLMLPYQSQIDISALPFGMYYVKDEKNNYIGKFIKI